jgi:DNA-binding transcriptional ArsR family regulator
VAQIFAALGDGTRLALLSRLCDGHPRSIVQLTQGTGLTRQGVSKHLAILKDACVVSSTRVGRQSLYVIRPDALQEARLYLERASHQWDEAVQRLKHLVED